MSSGVAVNPDCVQAYQQLKMPEQKQSKDKGKYIIFKLSDDMKQIIVEKTSSDTNYDSFTKDLPETEPRWAVYDVEFEKDGGKRNKLTFISWSPDDAKIKQKMVYASSRDALRRSLDGIAAEIQATSSDEVAWESVLDKASRGR
ncbi:unnamed protein product [Rhizoctonia solani]|uniref:Cofilin n=1 Tax=Rhizoctonia solani TaxID=456999 RepID=A0A8H3BIA9_9AGAM|nr:unnamed protein product [Rhizoctonia solani]